MSHYNFSDFWEDVYKEQEKYEKLSPEEKLVEKIDSIIKDLNSIEKQSIRDYNGHYIGQNYVLEDYEVEEILLILKEARRLINGRNKSTENM